jgi:hypothetical protein
MARTMRTARIVRTEPAPAEDPQVDDDMGSQEEGRDTEVRFL